MNKKMFFALAATVGLFASCSSDDIVNENASRVNSMDDNGLAKIEIGLTPSYEISRGTGMVGDVGGAANAQWAGQTFTVLMLEKGTMLGAYDTNARTPGEELLKGQNMTADGTTVVSLANDAKYYPSADAQGNPKVYDFWGYRLDNSETPTAGTPVFNGYDDANATQVTVPFKIDGTQDVMVATTTPSDATYATNHPELIYSAKSARNGVKPNLTFKHLLTSLTFKVKAKSRDITTAATNPTTDPEWQPGYQITNITLKSMATGNLIVAYTGNEPANRIEWGLGQDWADGSTLTDFQLQCRNREVNNKADIKMVALASNAMYVIPYAAGYVDMAGNSSYTPDATLLTKTVYDSNALDATTGLPTGNMTTLTNLLNGGAGPVTGYILTYNSTDRVSYETTAKNYECDYKALEAAVTTNLVPFADNCDVTANKVILGWTGYVPGAAAHTDAVEQSTMDAAAYAALDGALKGGDVDADGLVAATVQANDGKYYHQTALDKYYKIVYTAEVPAAAGIADVHKVGVPMLVAPSNDNANSGYIVTVTYRYWKKQTASDAVLTTKTTDPFVVNNYQIQGGAKVPGPFEAGKNYNVTITLYSDGEVLSGDATSTPWEAGDDLDANDEE